MSVSRCMREVDSAEFAEWMAFAAWEPFGPEREDQRAGMIAALIANVNRDSSKRSEPYEVEDFFPRYDEEQRRQEQAFVEVGDQVSPTSANPRLEAKILAWAGMMNKHGSKDKPKSQLRPKRKG